MKKLFSYCAAAALVAGLAACSNEQDTAIGVPDNAVRIKVSMGNSFSSTRSNPLGTEDEQKVFNVGDTIQLTYKNLEVKYVKTANDWVPVNNQYMLWDGETMSFEANTLSPSFLLAGNILDQSSLDKINAADDMYCSVKNARKADGAINLQMNRQTSRIIAKIAGFKNQFEANAKITDALFEKKPATTEFYSIKPYRQGDGGVGTTYTGLNRSDNTLQSITLTVNGITLKAPIYSFNFEAGKSYTFNLIVGKDKIEIGSVEVSDWTTGSTINGDVDVEFT